MQKLRKLFPLVGAILALALVSCGSDSDDDSEAATQQKSAGSISYATTSVEKTTADEAFTNSLTKTGDGTVTYASSKTDVATVNATTGEVTIVGAGETTITATVADSDTYTYATKTASYALTVTAADTAQQKTAGSISYATTTVSKTTADEAFTNSLTKTGDGTVSYASSKTDVAEVNATTGEVTIKGAGEATITATVTDSDTYTYATKTASYTLTVTAADTTQQKTAGSISYATESVKKTTDSTAFTNTLTKTGNGTVSYASDNTAVATVDGDGLVTIVGAGTATITATVTDSDTYTYATKTASYTVTVVTAKSTAETPSIAQADCTFSPANGTSTLSNANITTSMEYSADNGTTWTDVTSAGSIASLAAGTVQIRVKETDEKLASEAVSITVPEVLHINELVGPYTGDKLTCEYYAGETWQALVDRYDLIKAYSGHPAFGSDGFIYDEEGKWFAVTDLVDNTKTYKVE